jgi:hypothetical protein
MFIAWGCLCGVFVPKVGIGLDQKLAMPKVCQPSFTFIIKRMYL